MHITKIPKCWMRAAGLLLLPLALAACGRGVPQASYARVASETTARSGVELQTPAGLKHEDSAQQALEALLGDPLTAEGAVRIAVLNNRDLRANYTRLGVSQAAFVQAGLLHNPVLDAAYKFNLHGSGGELELGLMFDLVEGLMIPLRKKIAAAELQEAEWGVTASVVDAATDARLHWLHATANLRRTALRGEIAQAEDAALEFARRLRAAGNITQLELEQHAAEAGEARLDWTSAQVDQLASREALAVTLGLWGTQADAMRLELALPEAGDLPSSDSLERRAVEASLNLARGRSRIEAVARRARLTRVDALIADVEAGAEGSREPGGHWSAGPAVALRLPLFDWGGARRAAARAELEAEAEQQYARAVQVRSAARLVWARLAAAHARVRYDRDVKLPLHARLLEQMQLQYNAMQHGTFELLETRNELVRAQLDAIDNLEVYWQARAAFDRLLAGRAGEAGEGHTPSW